MRCADRLVLAGLAVFWAAVPLRAEPVAPTGRTVAGEVARAAWSRWSVTTRAFGSALSKEAQQAEGNRDRSSFSDQIGYGITPRLWAVGSFDYNLLELTDRVRPDRATAELAQLFLAGSGMVYPWPRARLRPFIGAGLGVGRSDIRSLPSYLRETERDVAAQIRKADAGVSAAEVQVVSREQVIDDYLVRTWTIGTEIGLTRRLALNLAFRQVLFTLEGTVAWDVLVTEQRTSGATVARPPLRVTSVIREDVVQSQIGFGVTYRF